MANQWFRVYSEFATDPKVQMLSEAMQRRLMMVFCLRCSNALVTLHETEIAFQLRISDDELQQTKRVFVDRGFIDEQWNVLNWEKRQFVSDSSSARVSRHREKKKEASNGHVTLQKRRANVSVTPPEQNRTEQNRTDSTAFCALDLFEKFWASYPQKKSKHNAKKAWVKLQLLPNDPRIELMRNGLAAQKKSAEWLKDGGQFIPHAATWLNQSRWEDEVKPANVIPIGGMEAPAKSLKVAL